MTKNEINECTAILTEAMKASSTHDTDGAYIRALQLFRRQIETRPVFKTEEVENGLPSWHYIECPNCGFDFSDIPEPYNKPYYCPTCGQAIDWSEDDEFGEYIGHGLTIPYTMDFVISDKGVEAL